MPKSSVAILYTPVIHQGVIDFFKDITDLKHIYIIDPKTLDPIKYRYLKKDIRALNINELVNLLDSITTKKVEILKHEHFNDLDNSNVKIIMPDDDISRDISENFSHNKPLFRPVFLRWDRKRIDKLNEDDSSIETTSESSAVSHIKEAYAAARKSADIWRRVGAVLVDPNEGTILLKACNTAESGQHTPWIEGDPRNLANRGKDIDISLFTHAEAMIISTAAKNGLRLEGLDLYCTDFPCPTCAKLISNSGISRVFYSQGYAVLDGKRVMEDHGVKLCKVSYEEPAVTDTAAKDYTKI